VDVRLEAAEIKMNTLIEGHRLEIEALDFTVYSYQKQIARLWISMNNYSQTITEFNEANSKFIACNKKFNGYEISNDYYNPKENLVARVLIHKFEKGDMVFDTEKGILCYGPEHKSLRPEPINCTMICHDE
jgi:hypothetical protein